MTEQELKEKIVIKLDGDEWCALMGENLQEGLAGFGETPIEAVRQLVWNILNDWVESKYGRDKALSQIHGIYLTLIKQANYVRLADDQSLPENPYSPPLSKTEESWSAVVVATHRAMLKAGFRKVEL